MEGSTELGEQRLREPLRRPPFRRLAVSHAVNELGDWFGIVALSLLVFAETGSALATTALFLASRFVPALVAPGLVVRAENAPPRIALPLIYCGEAAVFGGLALLAADFWLPAVIALAILDGTLALAGRALTRAVVATMLEPTGQLRAGNAVLNIGFTGGAAIGPALAGLAISGFGVQTALLLDAISFYLIAVLLLTTGPLPLPTPEPARWGERLREGLAYVSNRLVLRRLLAAQAGAFVFFAAVIPIEVIYATDTLGSDADGYGAFLASWGAGMVVGSFLFAGLRQRRLPVLLLFSTLAVGGAYLALAAAPNLAVACAIAAAGGAGNGVQWVSLISAVQELTVAGLQARVMSVVESIGAAMPGVGYLIGGVVAAILDPRASFVVAGGGVLVVVAVAIPLLARIQWTREDTATSPYGGAPAPADRLEVAALGNTEEWKERPGEVMGERAEDRPGEAGSAANFPLGEGIERPR